MIEKLIKAGAIVLAAAMLAACGGGNEPEMGKNIERGESGSATAAAAPTKTPETEPARAQRLDHLLPSPTAKPDPAATKTRPRATDAMETKAAEKPTPAGEPGETESAVAPTREPRETESAVTPASPRFNIADLVPENPQTNDQVLLQDIYEQIDLEQFALDPGEPIPFVELNRPNQVSQMKYPEVHEHPYLHLFPELKYIASQIERDFPYIPFMDMDRRDRRNSIMDETFSEQHDHFDLAATHSGLTYFIYNPWFEQVQYDETEREMPYLPFAGIRVGHQTGEPYWFGSNSTRGVLGETVAKLLEEAKLPSAEPYTRDWWTQEEWDGKKYIKPRSFAPREWTLEEYIRTGVQYGGPEDSRFGYEQVEFHNIPQVTWEFLDPKLPILRITAHAEQRLPLTDPASSEPPKPSEATTYSVSFVMSLQNRWTSFDDQDRWIVRFGEDLELHIAPPHNVDRGQGKGPSYIPDFWKDSGLEQSRYERFKGNRDHLSYTQDTGLNYPDYWDDTDYMQHRIIGPVILTVHKSPVLQPGTYSRIPRISRWEAPGHILTEEQVQKISLKRLSSNLLLYVNQEKTVFSAWPFTLRPNAGFPLPGHVMVTPQFGPGTETWKEHGMKSWEEYDRSLSEK